MDPPAPEPDRYAAIGVGGRYACALALGGGAACRGDTACARYARLYHE